MKLSQLIEEIEKNIVTEGRDERKEEKLMKAVDAACVAVAEAADVVGHKLDDLYDYAAQNGVDLQLPDVSYSYLDPGITLQFPVKPKLAVRAEARYLMVTSAGDIEAADGYGTASASGYVGEAGIEYELADRLALRALIATNVSL